nr:hypothetical protein KPHV_86020 [Kitasatospora purpeofusca]
MASVNLLRYLVQDKKWTYDSFCLHFDRAAETASEKHGDPRLALVTASQRQYTRWLSGELEGLPYPKTCLVLEELFDVPAEQLFAVYRDSSTELGPMPSLDVTDTSAVGSAPLDPALVPHWLELLQVLSNSHNVFGPGRLHQTALRELAVIKQFRQGASGELAVGLLGVEARWAEFVGWTAESMANSADAPFWLDQSLLLARHADDTQMVSYVLMRQAQRAVERRERNRALALAGQAWQFAGDSPRDRALCAVRQGEAHALAGDGRGVRQAIDQAMKLVDIADLSGLDDDPSTIGRHCVPAYVQAHEANCQLLLGEFGLAARTLESVLEAWPQDFRQDELIARTWLAVSYMKTGRLAEAGALASGVLSANSAVGSDRVHRGLRQLGQMAGRIGAGPQELQTFQASLALVPRRM